MKRAVFLVLLLAVLPLFGAEGRDRPHEKPGPEAERDRPPVKARGRAIETLKKRLREIHAQLERETNDERYAQLKKRADVIERQIRVLTAAGPERPLRRGGPEARIAKLEELLRRARERGDEGQVRRLQRILEELRRARREDGELVGLIERVAQLRKEALRLKRAGRLNAARQKWLEADELDRKLRRSMEAPPRPPRERPEGPPREHPGGKPPRLEGLLERAHRALEEKRWEEAAGTLNRLVGAVGEILRRDVGPEDRRHLAGILGRVHEAAGVLAEAGLGDAAEKIRHRAEELKHRCEPERPPEPEELRHLLEERAELARHLEEVERVEKKELARHIDELQEVMRRTEIDEKRADLRREIEEALRHRKELDREVESLRRRIGELSERIEHARGERPEAPRRVPERERRHLAGEAEKLKAHHRELEARLAEIEKEHRRVEEHLEELGRHLQKAEGPDREELSRKRRELQRQLRELEHNAEETQRGLRETEARLGEIERELRGGEEHRPDPWREIERLREEVRQLRELLHKALRER